MKIIKSNDPGLFLGSRFGGYVREVSFIDHFVTKGVTM